MDDYKSARKRLALKKILSSSSYLTDAYQGAIWHMLEPSVCDELSKQVRNVSSLIENRVKRKIYASALHIQGSFERSSIANAEAISDLSPQDFRKLFLLSLLEQSRHWRKLPKNDREVFQDALVSEPAVRELALGERLATTYGTELEFFGLNKSFTKLLNFLIRAIDPAWLKGSDLTIEPDDGTAGIEFVSPILDEKKMFALDVFSQFLNAAGAKAPVPCAYHVHAGIHNTFSQEVRQAVVKQVMAHYIAVENDLDFLDSALVKNYRDHYYLDKKLAEFLNNDFVNESHFRRDGNMLCNWGSRRRAKINLDALQDYGTIEFRHHPGTVQPCEITAWVRFIDDLFKDAISMLRENSWKPKGLNVYDTNRVKELVSQFREARGDQAAFTFSPPLYQEVDAGAPAAVLG